MYEYIIGGNHYGNLKVAEVSSGTWTTLTDANYGSNAGGTDLDDGTFLVADYVFSGIHRIDSATGQRSDFITGLGNPDDITQPPSGELLVIDIGNVRHFDSSGNSIQDIAVPYGGGYANISAAPNGHAYLFTSECKDPMAMDPCGFSSNPYIGEIIEIDPANGTATTLTSGNMLYQSGDIAVDASGIIYAATNQESMPATIVQIDPLSGAQTLSASSPYGAVNGLEFNWAGELLAVSNNGEMFNLTTSTTIATNCPSSCYIRGMTYLRTSTPLP